MTAAAQRTPVSILLELCNQNSWTPEYELTCVQGASHDPTFTYRVKVENIVATASGQSKRKAKHSAAKSALEQLLSRPDSSDKFVFENVALTAENLNEIVVEQSSEPAPVGKDSKNAVGTLQELCMKRKYMAPYYETVKDCGPPHDKTFTVQCLVQRTDDQFTTYGEGKTKRIAKRQAAEIMLNNLDDGSSEPEVPPNEEKTLIESECKEDDSENTSSSLHIDSSDSKAKSSSDSQDCNVNVGDELNHLIDDLSNGLSKIHADSD